MTSLCWTAGGSSTTAPCAPSPRRRPPSAWACRATPPGGTRGGSRRRRGAGGARSRVREAGPTAPWRADSRVEIPGPGRSKVLIGEDLLDAAGTLEVCISSILENSGRSCTNASTIVVPRRGAEVAAALGAPPWGVAWDQPHEGNLFELLYRRRALQVGEISAPVPGRS